MRASSSSRSPLAARVQARLLAGLRTACSASAAFLRRLDRDEALAPDPSERAYS